MPQIVAIRTKDDSSADAIAVVLSQDAVCLGPDGQPWSGVTLNTQLARSLAERLLGLASEIEGQEQMAARGSVRSLVQATSILVFHDGSEQGHRAFALARDLASRSRAAIQLVGVYGVRQDRFEPSGAPEDYEWQRGWLEKVVQMYLQEAETSGIELRTKLIPASDQQTLSDVIDGNGFDLIVLPRKIADGRVAAGMSATLQQSLAGAAQSTILFCP